MASPTLIRSTLIDDPDFAELVCEFVAEMPARIASMKQAFASSDLTMVMRSVHQLRGACGGYGFHSMTPMAGAIEDALRGGCSLEQISDRLDAFINACNRLSAEPE